MKSLFVSVFLFLLLSCGNEPSITPETVTSIEYGNLSGLAGLISKLTVYPQKLVFQPNDRLPKVCGMPISADQWAQLTQLVDAKALSKVRGTDTQGCADAGASWIIVRSATREVTAGWGLCQNADPSGIRPLIDALEKQRVAVEAVCK